MSHDLQFRVEHGDGTTTRPEMAMAGELDHLPDQYYQPRGGAAPPGSSGYGYSDSSDYPPPLPPSGPSASIQYIQNQLRQSSHPTVVIFHILFKAAALVLYLLANLFVPSKSSGIDPGGATVSLTVSCVLLLAIDFWTVKNVTGRWLVGLRWWNKVDDVTTTWIYESADPTTRPPNAFDQSMFWTILYVTPLVWMVLFTSALIQFEVDWILVPIMALALSIANVYGYYQCSSDQRLKFQQVTSDYAQRGALAVVRAGFMSALTGGSGSSNGNGGAYRGGRPIV